jgi:hypothetical protein
LEALIWLTSACPDLALVFLSAARVSAQDPFEIRIYEYEPLAQKSGRLLPLFFRGLLSESSDSSVASAAASIATGWSEPVPGRELHPLESSAFHGALLRQRSIFGY